MAETQIEYPLLEQVFLRQWLHLLAPWRGLLFRGLVWLLRLLQLWQGGVLVWHFWLQEYLQRTVPCLPIPPAWPTLHSVLPQRLAPSVLQHPLLTC